MRYRVTGGPDGLSGIEVAGQRYEVNATVELQPAKAGWLVEQGYLEPADGKSKPTEPEPDPQPSEAATEPSPANEDAPITEGNA